MKRFPATVLAFFALMLTASAAELGMEAPELKISKWIKGDPVELSAGRGTNIYVVEFWATWCAPCRVSIPHLTELQNRFRDRGVIIIGVSDETEEKVRPFVERMGKSMDYTVALDDDRQTVAAYLEAFGIDGIPHAFVIDKAGRIAWQGHPLQGLDQVLEDILEDRHDIEAANLALAAAKRMPEYFEQAIDGTNSAVRLELGERIIQDGANSPALLNEFAWIILTHPRIRNRDVELATRAARLAFEKTEGKDASVNDTYARAFFETGKFQEAVEMQKKAVAAALDDNEREQLTRTLKAYEERLK